MRTLDLKIEVPETIDYDLSVLKEQIKAFVAILMRGNNAQKAEPNTNIQTEDPFACFQGDWGGDTPVEEYCNELRYSGTQVREIEPW